MFMENYEVILAFLLGIFVSLFGYRLKKSVFFIAWFLVGYIITNSLMPTINTAFLDIANSNLWQILLPLAGGLLLSLLGFMIEKMCVALLCLAATIMFATNQFGWSTDVVTISGVIGVVLAGLATMLMKPATIIVTSAAGALVITNAIFTLVTDLARDTYYWPILIGIAVISIIFQFINTKSYA